MRLKWSLFKQFVQICRYPSALDFTAVYFATKLVPFSVLPTFQYTNCRLFRYQSFFCQLLAPSYLHMYLYSTVWFFMFFFYALVFFRVPEAVLSFCNLYKCSFFTFGAASSPIVLPFTHFYLFLDVSRFVFATVRSLGSIRGESKWLSAIAAPRLSDRKYHWQ